jgi:thiamine biosynthesis lipoprotein
MTSHETSASFAALGSTAVVAVTDPAVLALAREQVEQVIDRFDRACSRFREDSELIALNASAGAPVRVSPLLLEAVEAAVRAARLTDGDVDPTVGEALIALGYDRDFDEIGAGGATATRIASVPGWQTVTVDHAAGTVSTARGVVLDLGATAKALAADHAAAAAGAALGDGGVLVSLGGDLAIVGPPPASGWRIRVTDDHRSDASAPGQWITLRAGGLATSSTTVRRWETDGGSAHHLLDPATGRPVESPWRTVSVTAASCLDANIASTAAIIRGERAPDWLESLGLPSRLVRTDGSVLHLAGWPAEGDDLAAGRLTPAPVVASPEGERGQA